MGKGSPTPKDQCDSEIISKLYIADKYVCTMDPELEKMAKKDLREDEKSREQALEQMRQWIAKTDYIKDCRIDSNFLLRFLRHKKFSVPMAQETLLKYLGMRQQYPEWFHGISMRQPAILDLINRGVAFALPKPDKHGRRVLFTIGGNIDPSIHTAEDVMKAILVSFESFLEYEDCQIRGFAYILDEGSVTFSHLVLWNPAEVARIFGICEKSLPMRHKKLDFISLPPMLNYLFEFTKSVMSQKLRNRITLHRDIEGLKENIDTKILPKEYGGEMPMSEMIELYKKEIAERQPRLLALDRMTLDLDLMKKATTIKAISSDIMGMTGSFKKLEID